MSQRLMQRLTMRLCSVLFGTNHVVNGTTAHPVLAARLLGQSFKLWLPFMESIISKVFSSLIQMTMHGRSPFMASNAQRTLMRFFELEPELYLRTVGSELKAGRPAKYNVA